MLNHYDNESRLTEILRCVVDQTADATMLQRLGPARTREEIFISRALGKKPWAAIPPRTTLEMWLAFIAEDTAEPAPGSYTVRSCAESCVITYARRVKGATAIVPIFPPHDPYEIALAKLAGILPVSYGVQGRPWELLINQLAELGPRENVAVIYGSNPKHARGQIVPVQDLRGYGRPWPGGGGKNHFNPDFSDTTINGTSISLSGGKVVTSGSPSSAFDYLLGHIELPAGKYILSGAPSGGGAGRYRLQVTDYPVVNSLGQDNGSGVTFTLRKTMKIAVRIQMYVGAPYQLAFSPMIRLSSETDPTWEPYENICPITPGLDMLLDNGDRLVVWSGEINTGAGEIISRSAEIASYAGEQLPGPWISSLDAYTPGATPTIGAQVVYELSDPAIYRLTPAELRRALGCTKYLGVGSWKLCPGVMTVISAQLTTSETTTHYDLAPSTAEGWTFDISVDGQTATGAAGALIVEAGDHSITITATPAAGAAACYIHPTLYSEVAP